MYEIGSLVLYGRRGVYEVESVGPAPLLEDDGCVYYKLRSTFSSNHELIYTPVDTTQCLRPLVRGEEIAGYLERFAQMQPQVFRGGKPAELSAHYRELMSSSKPEDCLLLIKEISTKQREQAKHGKRLGQTDQQYLKLAERLICEEFAAALHTTTEAVKKGLHTAMRHKTASQKASG